LKPWNNSSHDASVRLELLPPHTWQQWDRKRLAKTGGTLEQYKHPCLIADPDFGQSIGVV